MTREFDRARDALAASALGRGLTALDAAMRSAWATSRTGRALRSIEQSIGAATPPARIRAMAIVVMTAAVMQPVLILAMPGTVAPALPWPAFVLVAMFAAAAAWQADAVAAAWPASRAGRRLRG